MPEETTHEIENKAEEIKPDVQITKTKKSLVLPKISKKHIKIFLLVILAALIGSGVYCLRGYIFAASVNGKFISRLTVIKELEKQGGASILETLITKELISQEASRLNIVVSQEELDAELQKIEQSTLAIGMTLEDALAKQNLTKAQLTEELRINKKLEKMVQDKVTVTEEEVKTYMEQNKEAMPENSDEATLKSQIAETLKQQKMGQAVQELLAQLKEVAKIQYYVTFN